MKLRTVLPMLAVATFALAACASKVDYDKFIEKAKEAAEKSKEVSFSEVVLDGYYTEDGKKQNIEKITIRFEKGAFATKSAALSAPVAYAEELVYVAMLEGLRAQNMPKSDKATYYAGSTFKVVYEDGDDKGTYEYNQYALLTAIKGDDSKLTVSYKK